MRKEHDYGWWLVRASNTGANIVARFEADSEENLKLIRAELQKALAGIGLSL